MSTPATSWTPVGDLRGPPGPPGEKGDPGPLAEGGSYMAGEVPAGAATVTITHNLGTRDVVVLVRETTGWSYVPVANDAPSDDTVRLTFTTTPEPGQYRYVLFAALGTEVPGPVAPAAHAPTHAAGGADPLTPDAIGAAPAEHTHPDYAPAQHQHAAGDVTSGTFPVARLPTGTSGSSVALGNHTHTGYAPHTHTHPRIQGPYSVRNFPATALGPTDPRTLATLTVPDPGFDWYPLCFAECDISSDINGTRPALHVRLGSVTGTPYARGAGQLGANNWTMAQAVPNPGAPVLAAGSARTFYLVMARDYGGGWVQSSGDFNPHLTIFVSPA